MKKLVSLLLALSLVFTLFVSLGSVSAETATVTVVGASTLPTDAAELEKYVWTAVLSDGDIQDGTTMNDEGRYYFVNKVTGLYLTDDNGTLTVQAKSDAAAQVWAVKDNWTNKYIVYNTATNNRLNTDHVLTYLAPSGTAGSDPMSDGVNTANGFEMIDIISVADGSTMTAIADGSEVYIASRYDSQLATYYLYAKETEVSDTDDKGEDGAEDEELGEGFKKVYTLTTTANPDDTSWWQLETAAGGYKFKNVKSGKYLTNNNGTLALSDTADTDYEIWAFRNNWGVTGHITSKADGLGFALFNGSLTLESMGSNGYEAVKIFDETDTECTFGLANVAANGDKVKITNHDNYANNIAVYLTVNIEVVAVKKEFTLAKTADTEEDSSWWNFIAANGGYKIQNVNTGLYLSNCEGVLVMSNVADTDNEIWVHSNNWGVTGHLSSKADGNYITLYGGSIKLISSASFSNEGWQSIRLIAEDGTDYHVDAASVAANKIAVKIVNRGNYDDGNPEYLTATTLVPETAAPTVKLIGSSAVRLNAVEGYQYSTDGINWQDSTLIENLTADSVIYQRNTATPAWYSEGITVELTGMDSVDELGEADSLAWLRKQLIENGNILAADTTADGEIDIRDLVRLKKNLIA